MDMIFGTLNNAGSKFVEFALPMLIQSSLLILIILAADLLLKKRVRAVFRYWIWMLVLVKLMLPASLYSPLSLGSWFGETIEYKQLTQEDTGQNAYKTERMNDNKPVIRNVRPIVGRGESPLVLPVAREREVIENRVVANPVTPVPDTKVTEPAAEPEVEEVSASISWQGIVFLAWLAIAVVLCLVLLKRTIFIREIVTKASEIDFVPKNSPSQKEVLKHCCVYMGMKRQVPLRISPDATSPVVCGLFRPVILLPQNLISSFNPSQLKAIFFHELAHIKRGDLWVNMLQTLLQIVYFYNPLLWLANSIIRRTREQAVDEMALVAMGKDAREYPQTLLNIAKLAFKRPALSLRLIGVVENEDALTGRIKHMLSRPWPKSAKLGLLGLLVIIVFAAILLPMARLAQPKMTVINNGPLDIKLIAICPDGYDLLYDANGKKLDKKPQAFLPLNSKWEEDNQCRDFIFEVPETEEQLLFPIFQKVSISEKNYGLGGSIRHYYGPSSDGSVYVYSAAFDREYRRQVIPFLSTSSSIDYIDLTLSYYYGPRKEAQFTFTGPFVFDKAYQVDSNSYHVTFVEGYNSFGTGIQMRFQTNKPYDNDTKVIFYDNQGKRYLMNRGGGRSGSSGANLTFAEIPLTIDEIAYITFGEKPNEITFKNVKVQYKNLKPRTYPEFYDLIAQRLYKSGISGQQLVEKRFENPADAIKVIDLIQGQRFIGQALDSIRYNQPRINIPELDEETQERLRQTAHKWTENVNTEQYGIKLGLMGKWLEFFDLAIERLNSEVPEYYNHPEMERAWIQENSGIADLMYRYRLDELDVDQIEKLKRLAQTTDNVSILTYVFYYLQNLKSQAAIDALYEMVQDDQPWIWSKAINIWYPLVNEGRLYDTLPEEIKIKWLLTSNNKSDEKLDEKADELLKQIFTPEFGKMSPSEWGKLRDRIVQRFDKKEATKLFINYLRQVHDETNARQWIQKDIQPVWNVINIISNLNLWYDVNIGNIGIEEPGRGIDIEPRTFSAFQTLIAQALSWYDENPNIEPIELAFAGKVVDTSGNPIANVKLSFTKMEDYVTAQGYTNRRRVEVAQITTGSNGQYSVVLDPKERWYELNITADGFATREKIMVDRLRDGRFRFREYDSQEDNVFILQRPGRISGSVLGADGKPLANTNLIFDIAEKYSPNDPARKVTTDSEGKFDIGNISTDPIILSYFKYNEIGQGRDYRQEYGGLCGFLLIENKEGQEQSGLVIDLSKSVCSLELEVKDGFGEPEDSINISFDIKMPPGSGYSYSRVFYTSEMKSDGIYKFDGLPEGNFRLRISNSNSSHKELDVELNPDKVASYQVDFGSLSARQQARLDSRETTSEKTTSEQNNKGKEVNGVAVRLGGEKPVGLFFSDNSQWYEIENNSRNTIEINIEPYTQKGTKNSEWGYLEVVNEKGEVVNYTREIAPFMIKIKSGKNSKYNSFLNGNPLRSSGPGTYKARVTLVVRDVESDETFEVQSNWHEFEVTLCGNPKGFIPQTAFDKFQFASACRFMVPSGYKTKEEVIGMFEDIIKEYPDSKYELGAHYGIAMVASEDRNNPDFVTESDYALSRKHYKEIIRKWPDVVTAETIHARFQAYSPPEFKQSRLDLYKWLKSLTTEQKVNSISFINPARKFERTREDIQRWVDSITDNINNGYLITLERNLKELDIPIPTGPFNNSILATEKNKQESSTVLNNGGTLELVGVSEHHSENKQWWKPDGSLLDKKPYDTTKGGKTIVHNNRKAYEFVVRTDFPESFNMTWKAEPSEETYTTSFLEEKDNSSNSELCVLVGVFPLEQKSCDLEINTESWITLTKAKENQQSYSFGDFTARVIPPKYEDGKYIVKVQETENEFDKRYKRRYVIKLKNSAELVNLESFAKQTLYNEGQLCPNETIYTLNPDIQIENIEYVAGQFGFEKTYTFKNVSLAAQHKTNIQTSSSGPGIPSFIYADMNQPPVPRLTKLTTGVVRNQKLLFFHSEHPQTLWQIQQTDKEHNPKWYFRINGVDYQLDLRGWFGHSRYQMIEAFSFPYNLKDKDKQWPDGDYSLSLVIKDTAWLNPKGKQHYSKEMVTDPIEFKIQDGSFFSKTGEPVPQEGQERVSEFKTTLPDRGTLELVGVRKKSLPNQPWYSPDGFQKLNSDDDIFSHISGSSGVINQPETQTYEFYIHCDLPYNQDKKVVKSKWSFEPEKGIPGSFLTSYSLGQHYFTASVALPETLNKTNLTFSVSNGPWKTIAENDGVSEKEISIMHRNQKQNVTLGKIVEKDGSTFIEVTHKVKEMAARIVVFDKNGNILNPNDNVLDYVDSDGNILITKCQFDRITIDKIDHYEFQIQPVDIVTFIDVSLKNRFISNPLIVTASINNKTPIEEPFPGNLLVNTDRSRANFPDNATEVEEYARLHDQITTDSINKIRYQYGDIVKSLNELGINNTPFTESFYNKTKTGFEALVQNPNVTTIYAQRRLIALDWLAEKIDAQVAANKLIELSSTLDDEYQVNFTKAFAMIILARDYQMEQAIELFRQCKPEMTPRWGSFLFYLNKNFNQYVLSQEINNNLVEGNRITQRAQTTQQWIEQESPLRKAMIEYADYLENDFLPAAAGYITSGNADSYRSIEILNFVSDLRNLINNDTHCFTIGATTDQIAYRLKNQILPDVLAIWQKSLPLLDDNELKENYSREILEHTQKLGISVTSLPERFEKIIANSMNVSDSSIEPNNKDFSAILSKNVKVELVGLCKEPIDGAKWWNPNGTEIPEPFFEASTRMSVMKDVPTKYTFLVKAQGGEDISMKAKIYEGYGYLTPVAQDGTALCFIKNPGESKPYHEDAFEKGPIEIGIAQGRWIKGRNVGDTLHIPRSYLIGGNDQIVIQPPRADNTEPDMVTSIWANVTSHDYEFKLVCKLKDGSTRESEQSYFTHAATIETGGLRNSSIKTFQFAFDRLTFDQIVDYELYYRKFEFVRLDNVAFKPVSNNVTKNEVASPFSVYGKVTDENGNPVSGVAINANCGMGTLMPTGETITDENGNYRLYFSPGILMLSETDPLGVGFQAAIIFARKDGHYEKNLCREGNLSMSGNAEYEMTDREKSYTRGVVLPNKPYKLDFVMQKAALIHGTIVDSSGKPVPDFKFNINGPETYPASSVLQSLQSDANGTFIVKNVPLKTFWFYYGNDNITTKTNSFTLNESEEYMVELRYYNPVYSKESLQLVSIKKSKVQDATEIEWGKVNEGAQIRLDKARQIWGRSDWMYPAVQLQLEAKNNGQNFLSLPENSTRWQIEVDGKWYDWISPRMYNSLTDSNSIAYDKLHDIISPSIFNSSNNSNGIVYGQTSVLLDFDSGKSYDNLKVDIAGNWREIPQGKEIEYAMRKYSEGWIIIGDEYGSELILKSGTHNFRVAIICPSARAGHPTLRLISNPIEFEILPMETSEVDEIRELSENYFSALRRMNSGQAAELLGSKSLTEVTSNYVMQVNLSEIYPKIAYLSDEEALLISAALEPFNKEEEPQEMRIGLRNINDKWIGSFVEMGTAGDNGKIENFLSKYPNAKAIVFVPPKVPDDNEVPWGKAIDDIQIRVRMDQQFHEGQIPKFLMDVRNNKTVELDLVLAPEWWELELDGIWYETGAWYSGVVPSMLIDSGEQKNGIEFVPTERWKWNNNHNPLKFLEGKHQVRLLFTVFCNKPYNKGSTRVVSNPIEIEVLPKEVQSEAKVSQSVNDGLNIYLLADETMDFDTAKAMPLSELVLRDKPWISSQDIEMYDASSHCIYLKKERPEFPFKITSVKGVPFVITANGQKCYMGIILPAASSYLPENAIPMIHMTDFIVLPSDIIRIQHSPFISPLEEQIEKELNSPNIVQAFKDKGQYHAGLGIVLDKVEVSKSETGSSLSYTYTLINKDADDLYVFDPDKMGVGLFHYFNNCPGLLLEGGEKSIDADHEKVVKAPDSFDTIDKSWFSLIKSGQKMTRTVTLDAYPEIPQGKYECSFMFHSPGPKFTKEKRSQFDQRVWIGQIFATLKININEIEPLPSGGIYEMFKRIMNDEEVDLNLIYQSLLGPALKAEAIQYLGNHGDSNSIPYLIDSLSDESYNVGTHWIDKGMYTTRYWANDSLKKLTGLDTGFVWNDPIDKRNKAIQKWKYWWEKYESTFEVINNNDRKGIENIVESLWRAVDSNDTKKVSQLYYDKIIDNNVSNTNGLIRGLLKDKEQVEKQKGNDIAGISNIVIKNSRAIAVTKPSMELFVYYFVKPDDKWFLYYTQRRTNFSKIIDLEPSIAINDLFNNWPRTKLDNEAFSAYLEAGNLLLEGTERGEVAKKFEFIGELYPFTEMGKISTELGTLLEEMVQEDKEFIEPSDINNLTAQQKIDYYIYKLRNVAERELTIPGECYVLRLPRTPNSAAVALRNMGPVVIPAMISLLEERRPTRSVGLSRNGGVVLRYCDIALEIIADIAGQNNPNETTTFDPRSGRGTYLSNADEETAKQIIKRAKSWWEQNKDKYDLNRNIR